MVILDLQFYLEEGGDPLPGGPESAPTSFLPERSRILVTSSYVIASRTGTVDQDVAMICGLKFARWATCLHVVGVDEKKAVRYLQDSGVDASNVSTFKRKGGSSLSMPPLRLSLSAACMRLLGITSAQFRRLCQRKVKSLPSWPGSDTIFSSTMAILWKAINDYEPLAGRMLATVSIVDRLNLPIHLIAKVPIFATLDGDVFSSVINLLLLSGLVEIHDGFGHQALNIPLTIYRWVQLRLRAVEDEEEYGDTMKAWATVLTEYLAESPKQVKPGKSIFSAERFWPMIGHVTSLCNFKPGTLRVVCSLSYMKFLEQVALVLVDDGILFNQGLIAITHALDMCVLLQDQSRPAGRNLSLHRDYVSMLQTRALAFSKASKFPEAKAELREAERYLHQHLRTDSCYNGQRRRIDDAKAHLSVIQQDFPEALRLLSPLIASSDTQEDPFIVAQRHFWLTAYKTSIKADSGALKHSHVAMKFWIALPEHERWGHKDSRRLHWIENHMICLMYLGKYKGALLFGRPLLKRAQQLTPNFGISLCRMTYRVILCLSAVGKLDEAEEAVCYLLARSDYKRVEDETLSHLLVVLHALGQLLQMHGRTVEAEGVYRYILRGAKQWNVQSIGNPSRYDVTGAWTRLVMCLMEQGKFAEARAIRDKYEDEADRDRISRLIVRARAAYKYMTEVYQKRLEAERTGYLLEFEALIDLYGLGPELDEAITMFGDPKQRIEEDRDFESDIDIHKIGRARKSKVLQLLRYPMIYQSFVHLSSMRLELDYGYEDLWSNREQTLLGQYWSFCECKRKRQRSASACLDVLVVSSLLKRRDAEASSSKSLKQKSLDDWVTRIPTSKPFPPGCSESCPCVAANLAGEKETMELESRLFLWKDSDSEEESNKPRDPPRYRRRKPKRQPIPDHEIFTYDAAKNSWLWLQSEWMDGDREGENYIIPNALDIPGISITPPEGDQELLPEAKEDQSKLTEHYERDFAAEYAMELTRSEGRRHECHRLDDILEDDE